MSGNPILFVDDEKKVLASLQRELSGDDFTLCFAESAEEALGILEHQFCKTVVADVKMPGITGFELLEEEVRRDSLSGLFNRRFFDENLRQELNRAKRLQHSLNLALIDIDHFKSINDQYGHQVGDEAIVALADSMQQAFRRSDILCRYGGEEFAVIMPDSSIEAAFKATQRLQTLYRKTCSERDLKCGADISFTAGIASFPSDIDTEEGLIQLADQRLYKGKNKGRNQVRIDTQILRTINTD